jgi:hypothetical protein
MVSDTVVCAKIRFASEREAMRRLIEIAFEPDERWRRQGKPDDCYFHRRCSAWHLARRIAGVKVEQGRGSHSPRPSPPTR